jgi:copper homeostasis protein
MKAILFELCAESLHAARAAQAGGASRIELCSSLRVGGLTPDFEFVAAVSAAVDLPIQILIRPRDGDYFYSSEELDAMANDIERARRAGARGVVLGVLSADGTIDVQRCRELIAVARPMHVTFNRAFDESVDLPEALEAVIQAGADDLLTSGGAPDVHSGAKQIASLLHQAGNRIGIIAGGGLRVDLLPQLIQAAGIRRVHGSLLRRNSHGDATFDPQLLEGDVHRVMTILRSAAAAPQMHPVAG